MQEYAKKERSLGSVYDTIGDLFEGHPDLQAEFVNFLPKKMQSKMNGSRANRAAAAQQRDTLTNKSQDGSIDAHKVAASNVVGPATPADRPLDTLGDRRTVEPKANPMPERRDTAPVRPCKPCATSPTTADDVSSNAADDTNTRDVSPSCAPNLNDGSTAKHNDPDEGDVSAADRNEACSNGDSAAEHDDPSSKSNDGSPAERNNPDSDGASATEQPDPDHSSRTRPVLETSPKRLKTEPSTGSSE